MTERIEDGQLHGLTAERLCAALEWRLYAIRRWVVLRKRKARMDKVARVLSDPRPFRHFDSDELFASLQDEYAPLSPYGYDAHSAWCRASKRVNSMLSISELRDPGRKVLEVAAGDGMTGRLLSDYGHDVALCDIEDWRDDRARHLPFRSVDVCQGMPFDDVAFDFIYSYNAFEHLSDPFSTLREMERVCRTEGLILLSFGPLYCSPWGLHAYRALRMPYPQFLFSRSFVDEKIAKLGIYDLGRTTYSLQPLNEWCVVEFRLLWHSGSLEVLEENTSKDESHLDVVLRFADAFCGRDLTVEDLTANALYVLLRKKA